MKIPWQRQFLILLEFPCEMYLEIKSYYSWHVPTPIATMAIKLNSPHISWNPQKKLKLTYYIN